MYILDQPLTQRIKEIAQEADIRSGHRIAYKEFIAVPYFGQIVLRFTLRGEGYGLEELDRYERLLCDIVGDEFLTDFMGSVYRKAGVDYSDLERRLIALGEKYGEETVTPSRHGEGIRADAACLLEMAGLPADSRVWEIQPEENAFVLILLGTDNRRITGIGAPYSLEVLETREAACIGLMKAAVFCKRTGVSLARLLLET